MTIYLINLDRDADRLTHMARQMDGVPFERIPAFDGYALSDHDLAQFRAERPDAPWSRGQVGCFYSHFEAWRRIAAGEEAFGLVLEDDLHLSSDFAHFSKLDRLPGFPTDADLVRLEAPNNAVLLGSQVLRVGGRALRPVKSSTWCAGAYLLSRSAAQKLLSLEVKTHTIADYFLFSYEDSPVPSLLNLYQLTPAVAIQDKFSNPSKTSFASNIETEPTEADPMTLAVLLRKGARFLQGYRRIKTI
jgi:glycosyl transferase family 25